MNGFRYHPRGTQGDLNRTGGNRFPLQPILIAVLALALVTSLFFAVPSTDYRAGARGFLLGRMHTECEAAVNASKMLSRTISSNSNAQLATVRSGVYAMDVLNQTYAALEGEGSYPVDPTVFTNLYAVIDSYYSRLATGNQTTDPMAALTEQLDALQALVAALD